MAELVDALGLGPSAARCGGSSPLRGTNKNLRIISATLFSHSDETQLILINTPYSSSGGATDSNPV
jgi:hypothetical protein